MTTVFKISQLIFFYKKPLSRNLVFCLLGLCNKAGGNIKRFNATRKLHSSLISSLFLLKALSWNSKNTVYQEKDLLEEADKLYELNQITELYQLLIKHKDKVNDELLWRLARAVYEKSKITTDIHEKKLLIYEAFEYIKKSLEVNCNNFAVHKWYAVLLDSIGKYEGTKSRITNAFIVRDHLKKAIEINPKDSTSIYSLGYWCFLFADMPWYQRKIASVIFTTPPISSYDEAFYYFQKAEEMDPNFYSMNLLMLGKTCLRMNNIKLAFLYLTKARDYPVKTPDDKEAHEEAIKLLMSLGIKV